MPAIAFHRLAAVRRARDRRSFQLSLAPTFPPTARPISILSVSAPLAGSAACFRARTGDPRLPSQVLLQPGPGGVRVYAADRPTVAGEALRPLGTFQQGAGPLHVEQVGDGRQVQVSGALLSASFVPLAMISTSPSRSLPRRHAPRATQRSIAMAAPPAGAGRVERRRGCRDGLPPRRPQPGRPAGRVPR
jgi:hypothetical protein